MAISLARIRDELLPGLQKAMAKSPDNWQELAKAALDLGQLTGVEVRVSLNLAKDVMCCKVAGNTVEITRLQLEERNFVNLYDALKTAMAKAGIEEPEQFLVQAPPRSPTATEIAMQLALERQKFEQALVITRKAINENQFKYLSLARFMSEPEPEEPTKVVWREPRSTPELDLGEPSRAAEMAVLMHEPPSELLAPDLILEEEGTDGTSKKVAS
jgi:hypothetical protein